MRRTRTADGASAARAAGSAYASFFCYPFRPFFLLLWSAAFVIFLVIYTPILVGPRANDAH